MAEHLKSESTGSFLPSLYMTGGTTLYMKCLPDFLLEFVDELSDPVPVLLVLLRLELQLLDAPLPLRAVLRVVRRHLHRPGQLEVKLKKKIRRMQVLTSNVGLGLRFK